MRRLGRMVGVSVALCLLVACADPFSEGKAAYSDGDYAKALSIWKPLAEEGNREAQSYVGVLYNEGKGVEQDYAQAVEWFRRSAEQGYGRAQFNLAVTYVHGEGVERDMVQAYKWFLLADEADIEQAIDGISLCEESLTEDQLAEGERLADEWRNGST